jgi:hypothetical protein
MDCSEEATEDEKSPSRRVYATGPGTTSTAGEASIAAGPTWLRLLTIEWGERVSLRALACC